MSTSVLKEALANCLINFDRRITLTDLLQEYELNYADVHQTLEEYLRQQESEGVKYEKRFLIKGQERDSDNEVFTVVKGEQEMKNWLQRLQNAESALYSVEVAGGAKSPAYAFKPLQRAAVTLSSLQVRELNLRQGGGASTSNGIAAKTEIKPAVAAVKKSNGMDMFSKKSTAAGSKKTSPEPKKSPPAAEKKTSPADKKTKGAVAAGAANKKGLVNFFAPATSATAKKQEADKKSDSKAPASSPKKMQDFFKKQAETKPTKTEKTSPQTKAAIKKEDANESVQLFADSSAEEEDVAASSDEEEKLAILKRNIITSDHEMDADDDDAVPQTSNKRRRIIDSDDDEDDAASTAPQQKIEKKDTVDITEDNVPQQSETYLDEDGFVITIKPKNAKGGNKKSPLKSPRKSPVKLATKSPAKAGTKTAAAAKTKQGNIMNFFSKK